MTEIIVTEDEKTNGRSVRWKARLPGDIRHKPMRDVVRPHVTDAVKEILTRSRNPIDQCRITIKRRDHQMGIDWIFSDESRMFHNC